MHTANHPTELVKGLVGEGWSTDRNQAMGAFATNFIGGGGAAGKIGARSVAHSVEGAVAKDTAKTVGQSVAEDAAGAVKHVDDASEAVGKLDPDDPRSLPAAVDKNTDIDGMRHSPVWREGHEPLYRNDNRHPGEIFEQGFHPRKSSNTDLFGYVEGNHASAFVGTTRMPTGRPNIGTRSTPPAASTSTRPCRTTSTGMSRRSPSPGASTASTSRGPGRSSPTGPRENGCRTRTTSRTSPELPPLPPLNHRPPANCPKDGPDESSHS